MKAIEIRQTGNNNAGIIVNGSIINISITDDGYLFNDQNPAILDFLSREYYQLLVTDEKDALKRHIITIPIEGALHQKIVPPEIYKRCSSLSNAAIEELKNFPAIVCRQNTGYDGKTDEQIASLAHILDVYRTDSYVQVTFSHIKPLSQLKLSQNATHFGLNMGCALTDLNRNEWSVHRVNLLEAIAKTGILIETGGGV